VGAALRPKHCLRLDLARVRAAKTSVPSTRAQPELDRYPPSRGSDTPRPRRAPSAVSEELRVARRAGPLPHTRRNGLSGPVPRGFGRAEVAELDSEVRGKHRCWPVVVRAEAPLNVGGGERERTLAVVASSNVVLGAAVPTRSLGDAHRGTIDQPHPAAAMLSERLLLIWCCPAGSLECGSAAS
jgi:hypothetical protein